MLHPMRDKLLECGKHETTCPPAHQPKQLRMLSLPNLQGMGSIRACSTRSCLQCVITIAGHCVQVVDPQREGLWGKAFLYTILGHGEEVPLVLKSCVGTHMNQSQSKLHGYQHQPWCYGKIFTPQVNLSLKIWGQPGRCNEIRVHPYSLKTAYQCRKHLYMSDMDVWSGLRWISASTVT